jgi:hypothetical protein
MLPRNGLPSSLPTRQDMAMRVLVPWIPAYAGMTEKGME